MKITRVAIIAALSAAYVLLAGSCDFSFLGAVDDGGQGEVLTERVEAFAGGERHLWFAGDELRYFEDRYIDAGRATQVERYSAGGELRYGYLYRYDDSGYKTLSAYFDSSSSLRWYQVYGYQAGRPETSAEFDAGGVGQWSRRHEYGAGVLADTIIGSASFDGSGVIDGYAKYAFDDQARVTFMTAYGTKDCSVARGLSPALSVADAASPSCAGPAEAGRTVAPARPRDIPAPSKKAFAEPSVAAPPVVPAMPSAAELEALATSGYGYWYYDSHGSSAVELSEDWYPLKASRTDDRLDRPVSVEVEWAGGRISRKRSWYGSTLALDVSMSYTPAGYPLKATTSGAALLLPLDYELSYEGDRPIRLSVSSGGSLLQYFTYEYSGPTLPSSVAELRGIDPFAVLSELADAIVSINHYDGDGLLIESFTFKREGSSLRVDVRDAAGALNGYYLASYDAEGRAASLSSRDASGTEQWAYAYGYADALRLAHTEAPELGRLAETYLTDEVASYAKAFVMDLIF